MRRFTFLASLAIFSLLIIHPAASAQEWYQPIAGWDHQLFPSYLVATATIRLPEKDEVNEEEEDEAEFTVLGDAQGALGVELESPGEETAVTVTVLANAVLEESTFTGTLDEEGTYRIFPRIRYKYDVLTKNHQSIPLEVTFNVTLGEEELGDQTVTLTLRSINDCPFGLVQADGKAKDISFMFAAYVNEQHPFVDKILREALNGGVVNSFVGYQSHDPAEVYRQVYAIWNALSARDVRYSNITTSAAATAAVYSQNVRLIDQSINNGQANCVDGSVLLASLLRKIDIEPSLVYVPGHCYLAFYLDAEKKTLIGLETTLIGSTGDESVNQLPDLKDVVDEETRKQNSWLTFCAAVAMGNKDLVKNEKRFNKGEANFQIVSIAAARQIGILPIAFDSATQFEAVSTE